MSEAMEISQESLQTIGNYVKGNLAQWIREVSPSLTFQMSPDLGERLVRIEESIDKQQALMTQGFDLMEKRFEQVDKRFEEAREDMVSRFEQVDRRFEDLREDMNGRFEQVDKRFVELRVDMNARFDQLFKQGQRQTTVFGLLIGALTLLVAYGTFLG